jgi:hypothetical protein
MAVLDWATREADMAAAERVPYRLPGEVPGMGAGDPTGLLVQGGSDGVAAPGRIAPGIPSSEVISPGMMVSASTIRRCLPLHRVEIITSHSVDVTNLQREFE